MGDQQNIRPAAPKPAEKDAMHPCRESPDTETFRTSQWFNGPVHLGSSPGKSNRNLLYRS